MQAQGKTHDSYGHEIGMWFDEPGDVDFAILVFQFMALALLALLFVGARMPGLLWLLVLTAISLFTGGALMLEWRVRHTRAYEEGLRKALRWMRGGLTASLFLVSSGVLGLLICAKLVFSGLTRV